jgi:hypothetical protein
MTNCYICGKGCNPVLTDKVDGKSFCTSRCRNAYKDLIIARLKCATQGLLNMVYVDVSKPFGDDTQKVVDEAEKLLEEFEESKETKRQEDKG